MRSEGPGEIHTCSMRCKSTRRNCLVPGESLRFAHALQAHIGTDLSNRCCVFNQQPQLLRCSRIHRRVLAELRKPRCVCLSMTRVYVIFLKTRAFICNGMMDFFLDGFVMFAMNSSIHAALSTITCGCVGGPIVLCHWAIPPTAEPYWTSLE